MKSENLKIVLVILYSSFSFITVWCQSEMIDISFSVVWNGTSGDSVTVDKLFYYLSDVKLVNDGKMVCHDPDYHLVKHEDYDTVVVSIACQRDLVYDRIEFQIGVDSITQSSGPKSGALDPIHGMYWTWQSGYINFKLEGRAPICPARKNKFVYHLGGFLYGFRCDQKVLIPVIDQGGVAIDIDLDYLFSQINLKELYHIMSPGTKAKEMSNLVAQCFKIRS